MNTRRLDTSMLNDPFFIGFDRMIDRMRQETPSQANYPPYNIVKTSEENYELQLAIAGFTYDDLDIEVKDGVLTIAGDKNNDDVGNYLHRGISARSFRRTFTLSDTIVVNGANLDNGILTVVLENVIPEEKKPRKITIDNGNRKAEVLNG
jgi:molecular chaperone IbpA